MAARWFIALDLGTAFIKGAVLDLERLTHSPARRAPFPAPIAGQPALFCEVDPAAILQAARQVLDELLAETPECQGLVMCGQMGGLVVTDSRGAPLTNYIAWRDQRLLRPHPTGDGTYFERLARRLTAKARNQLGNEVRPGLTLSYLFWLAEAGRLPAGAGATTLPDFVAAQLCGAAPAMERTLATGALNLETGDWHTEAMAALGVAGTRWPRLLSLAEPMGYLESGGRLACYPPVGDHQCALAGVGLASGELSLNIATGSQASRLSDDRTPGPYQIRPYFDGQFLQTITHIPAGRALNGLLGLLTELAPAGSVESAAAWDYIEEAARRAGETDLAVDLAFFPSPVGERGAIRNIGEHNLSVGHVFRAAFANMADSYRTCALRLSPERDWHTLVLSGGLAQKSRLLRELIEARLPGPQRLCADSEDTLRGLLALALAASGRAASVAAATKLLRDHERAGGPG